MLNLNDIRSKFITFYEKRGHAAIPSSSLVPENDSSTLFTSSGMQPLLRYFLGTPHPQGKRIVDAQKCFRSVDIDEVGDRRHTTFFEMLGNWSFGDYFKREQLTQVFHFFVDELGLDVNRLYVTVFGGEPTLGLPADEESIAVWQELFASKGVEAKVGERIFVHSAANNWWSRSGVPAQMPAGEPGGGDSEIFYDFGEGRLPVEQITEDNSDLDGRLVEIGNSVFMQYQKTADGKFADLPQKNVDYGGGLERLAMALEGKDDIFETSIFQPLIAVLEKATGQRYTALSEADRRPWRIIADHLRSSVMLAGDGVTPANKEQGYVLRRLLRKSMVAATRLGLKTEVLLEMIEPVIQQYSPAYPSLATTKDTIRDTFDSEIAKFARTLERGLREIDKLTQLTGEKAFFLYESYGFPWELTRDIAAERGLTLDEAAFVAAKRAHQQVSRGGVTAKFRGGLADHDEQTVKFHTATHLLLAALRQLDPQIHQEGSNITGERARFDFNFPRALTPDEIAGLQQQINDWIKADLPVTKTLHPKAEALTLVGGSPFADRYPDEVSVYTIGDVSCEICIGPHVEHTGEIGAVTLQRESSAGGGKRRLYVYFA